MKGPLAAALLVLLLGSAPARAQDDSSDDDAPRGPRIFAVELGGGVVQMTGADVLKVYTPTQPDAHFRAGIRLFQRMLDLGIGADFAQFTGWRLGQTSGTESAEPTRLTLTPISLTALYRLELKKDQPVVPYAGGGYSYLIWNEENVLGSTNPDQKTTVSGGKYGWTALAGVQFYVAKFKSRDPNDSDDEPSDLQDAFVSVEAAHDQDDYFGRHPVGLDMSHWAGRVSFGFEF